MPSRSSQIATANGLALTGGAIHRRSNCPRLSPRRRRVQRRVSRLILSGSFLRSFCSFRPPRLKRYHTTAVLTLFLAKELAQSG
jgi:hypothetical protein